MKSFQIRSRRGGGKSPAKPAADFAIFKILFANRAQGQLLTDKPTVYNLVIMEVNVKKKI